MSRYIVIDVETPNRENTRISAISGSAICATYCTLSVMAEEILPGQRKSA